MPSSFDDAVLAGPGLQDCCERAGEPGQDILAIERLLRSDDRLGPVVAIDASQAAQGIYDPDEPRPSGEPVGHLGEDLTGAVARRQYLHDEIGGELGVPSRVGGWDPLAPDERDVGSANGVGIGLQLEPRLRSEQRARAAVIDAAGGMAGT